ncbi:MAG: hypothetical protein ABEJ83_00640 [Candidatus Nanohaloarchaea archaeon]
MFRKKEDAGSKTDIFYINEDPARVMRDFRDVLVEELGVDRVDHSDRQEYDSSSPKDKPRLYAYIEKSPYTTIRISIGLTVASLKYLEEYDREGDFHKAKVSVSAEVLTTFPGGEPEAWGPEPQQEYPWPSHKQKTGLRKENLSNFEKSKIYDFFAGLWYKYFYSGEIEKYKEEAEEKVVRLTNLMRERFGVEKTIHKSGASEYHAPWK